MVWESNWQENNILLKFVDFTVVNDLFHCSLLCDVLLLASFTTLWRLFIICLLNANLGEFLNECLKNTWLLFTVLITVVCNCCLFYLNFQTEYMQWAVYLFRTIVFSAIAAACLMLTQNDTLDFAQSLNDKSSIGALWANGACWAYYEKSLCKFKDRVQKFEEAHPDIKLLVKKLVLIAPLSCNIEGCLSDKDEISYVGDLEPIECDKGANMNRRLRSNVYELYKDKGIYIAAEFPSPLGALWGEREGMTEESRIYIRDCFLKELKELLQSYPVIILEYDDLNPSETVPLPEFIMSSLQKHLKEDNFTNCCMKMD